MANPYEMPASALGMTAHDLVSQRVRKVRDMRTEGRKIKETNMLAAFEASVSE